MSGGLVGEVDGVGVVVGVGVDAGEGETVGDGVGVEAEAIGEKVAIIS